MIPSFIFSVFFFLLGCRVRSERPGKETYIFGLTVLMQSSSFYLVNLLISSACVFSSLAD